MKCVNCGKAEAVTAWDSLAFRHLGGISHVSEWATGYEKAGLCDDCRRELAGENEALLYPKRHRTVCTAVNVLAAVGAALMVADSFVSGSPNSAIAGVCLLLSCVVVGLMKQKNSDSGALMVLWVALGLVGLYGLGQLLFNADRRGDVGLLGWAGIALLALGALGFWIGRAALKRAANTSGPRDALLLGRVMAEDRRYVPLGEGLYGSRKEFLAVNSLLSDNEQRVYDEFIATGKWTQLVKEPGRFQFTSPYKHLG